MLSSPPSRVGGVHQRLGGLLDVAAAVAHHARDLVVGDHGGEAVRAEQEDVAGLDLVHLHVDLQVGLAAQRARDHVAQRDGCAPGRRR